MNIFYYTIRTYEKRERGIEMNLHGLMPDKCHENKKHYCLPKGEIFKSFEDGKFNVMRSSGIIEKGWYIQEPVVRYGIGTGYTCRDT
jgi:hypothetical protein